MNTEKLIAKGVKKHFNGQIVLFSVESLKEHFGGLQIHTSDIVEIENWENDQLVGTEEFILAADVNFDQAEAKEVAPIEEEVVVAPETGMTYEEAEKIMDIGGLIALPEWGGFWFKSVKNDEILVLTKEGEITNTPYDEFKDRNDWKVAEATPEQQKLLEEYWASLEAPQIPVEVTEQTLADNIELVAEGITAGEIITVDAEEVVAPAPAKTPKPRTPRAKK